MRGFLNDLRFSFPISTKNPGFTAVALFSLSLGIGATTTIFSVIQEVLLAPAPYEDTPRQLVPWESNPSKGLPETPVAPANFRDRLEDSRSFEDIKLIPPVSPVTMTGRCEHASSKRPRGTMLSADLHWHWKDFNTRTSTKIAGDTPIR